MALRKLVDSKIAYSAWILPNGNIHVIKENPEACLAWVQSGAIGEPGPPPEPGSIFKRVAFPQALNTADGWPERGDTWEAPDPSDKSKTVLVVANSINPSFTFGYEKASDPGTTKESLAQFVRVDAMSNWELYREYDIDNPPEPKIAVVSVEVDDRTIPNHKSSTYDSNANGSVFNDSPVVIAGVVSANSNRHLSAFVSGGQYLATTLSVSWNGDGLTQRINQAATAGPSGACRSECWDLVNPDSGSHNVTFTFDTGFAYGVIGIVSSYGVDQTTPRSATNSGDWTNFLAHPTLTLSGGATDELAISLFSFDYLFAPTTTDGTWTELWNTTGSGSYAHGAVAYRTGAASVTREDAPIGTAATLIISLKAAAGGGPTPNSGFFFLL